MEDFEVTQIEDPITHFVLFAHYDPTSFESAVKEENGKKQSMLKLMSLKK